jgi:hypothetical protein
MNTAVLWLDIAFQIYEISGHTFPLYFYWYLSSTYDENQGRANEDRERERAVGWVETVSDNFRESSPTL